MRKVILHYHLFKNAGTSLDSAFRQNFKGDEWVTKEFPAQIAKNRQLVEKWILNSTDAKCFSSHTAFLPPPSLKGIKILPVIFMRHPIDRIASAYSFERNQESDGFGAVLARNTDFSGYVETRLSLQNDRQCRNFHTHRFAMMFGEKQGDEFVRAKKAIEALPFVGIVEQFSDSLASLEAWLQEEGFDNISIKNVEKNVSRDTRNTLDEKIHQIKQEIGKSTYDKLVEANQNDMRLYDILVAK